MKMNEEKLKHKNDEKWTREREKSRLKNRDKKLKSRDSGFLPTARLKIARVNFAQQNLRQNLAQTPRLKIADFGQNLDFESPRWDPVRFFKSAFLKAHRVSSEPHFGPKKSKIGRFWPASTPTF